MFVEIDSGVFGRAKEGLASDLPEQFCIGVLGGRIQSGEAEGFPQCTNRARGLR